MVRLSSNYERRPQYRARRGSCRRSRPRQHAGRAVERQGADRVANSRTRPASPRKRQARIWPSSNPAVWSTALKQGRHRYFRLSGPDVAGMLETMMGVAARTGHLRTRTGPAEPALRKARVCYDHLAGEIGVAMFDRLHHNGLIAGRGGSLRLTRRGAAFMEDFGIDVEALARATPARGQAVSGLVDAPPPSGGRTGSGAAVTAHGAAMDEARTGQPRGAFHAPRRARIRPRISERRRAGEAASPPCGRRLAVLFVHAGAAQTTVSPECAQAFTAMREKADALLDAALHGEPDYDTAQADGFTPAVNGACSNAAPMPKPSTRSTT